MNNNKSLIIMLIVIIAILIIALTGAIVYIVMQQSENSGNKIVVNTNNSDRPNYYDENEVENNTEENEVENNTEENEVENNTEDELVNNIEDDDISTPISPIEGSDDENTTVSDMEKIIFNSQFTSYLGKISVMQLQNLMTAVQTSNSTNTQHQIALTSNNMQDLNGLKDTDYFIITLTYDTEGYINRINIDKQI